MTPAKKLTEDILMSENRVYSKNCRIHERTWYVHDRHAVIHQYTSVTLRFLKWLPPKVREEESVLDIPAEIDTEAAIWDYVAKKKRFWIRRSR